MPKLKLTYFDFDGGRGEPARLALVEFWMATGKWPDCADDVPYDFRAECGRVQGVAKEGFGF